MKFYRFYISALILQPPYSNRPPATVQMGRYQEAENLFTYLSYSKGHRVTHTPYNTPGTRASCSTRGVHSECPMWPHRHGDNLSPVSVPTSGVSYGTWEACLLRRHKKKKNPEVFLYHHIGSSPEPTMNYATHYINISRSFLTVADFRSAVSMQCSL